MRRLDHPFGYRKLALLTGQRCDRQISMTFYLRAAGNWSRQKSEQQTSAAQSKCSKNRMKMVSNE